MAGRLMAERLSEPQLEGPPPEMMAWATLSKTLVEARRIALPTSCMACKRSTGFGGRRRPSAVRDNDFVRPGPLKAVQGRRD